MASSLERLVRMLSGGFNNQEQAFENPPLYAHILVKLRPLPQLAPGSLLLEQSYAINPAAPYRIRVLRAEAQNGQLTIVNQALADDQRFWGAVEDSELRSRIQTSDLIPLIFIPSPFVAEDHQTKNAMSLVQKNAALLCKDGEAKENITGVLLELLQNQSQLDSLSKEIIKLGKPHAAKSIVNEITEDLG